MRYLVIAVAIYLAPMLVEAEAPPPRGVTMIGIVTEVYDGDTITVQPLTPTVKLRLLDCWAPEVAGKGVTAAQKVRGQASRNNLRKLLPIGSSCKFRVDTHDRLEKSLTFGRVLAKVWSHKGVDVCEQQVEDGFATKTKQPFVGN